MQASKDMMIARGRASRLSHFISLSHSTASKSEFCLGLQGTIISLTLQAKRTLSIFHISNISFPMKIKKLSKYLGRTDNQSHISQSALFLNFVLCIKHLQYDNARYCSVWWKIKNRNLGHQISFLMCKEIFGYYLKI